MVEEALDIQHPDSVNQQTISREEISIDDLHKDLEKKLEEQGFIFDRRKFFFNDQKAKISDKLADAVAGFCGSWKFIGLFTMLVIIWISANIFILATRSFDPYPFVFLNLILACITSIQAPLIMMSQNRQAFKDKRQEEINLEKDIVDFKQDRLDLILDQKEWEILKGIDERLKNVEEMLAKDKPSRRKK
jgi:uncharacterized membrane protein